MPRPFPIYVSSLCVLAVEALAGLRSCVGLSEPSLVADAIFRYQTTGVNIWSIRPCSILNKASDQSYQFMHSCESHIYSSYDNAYRLVLLRNAYAGILENSSGSKVCF